MGGSPIWLLQLVVLPIALFLFVALKSKKLRKKYGVTTTEVVDSPTSVLFALFVVVSGSYIFYGLLEDWSLWLRAALTAAVSLVYGFYVICLYSNAVVDMSREDRLASVVPELRGEDVEAVDANDVRIAWMETEITSLSQRVEAYTLESALFGGLAFSGFLTLISSDLRVLPMVQRLAMDVPSLLDQVAQSGLGGAGQAIDTLVSTNNLLAAVTLETLLCSMFFLSVIVSRLHFYGILQKIDYAVRIARAYNDKEEEVYNVRLQFQAGGAHLDDRLDRLTRKVGNAIVQAEPLFRDIEFIANYMRGFRNLGIGSFVVILVSSAFLHSRPTGLLFIVMLGLAYIYGYVDKLWRDRRILKNPFFQVVGRAMSRR